MSFERPILSSVDKVKILTPVFLSPCRFDSLTEEFEAAGAAVLGGKREEVNEDVVLELLLVRKRCGTFRARIPTACGEK